MYLSSSGIVGCGRRLLGCRGYRVALGKYVETQHPKTLPARGLRSVDGQQFSLRFVARSSRCGVVGGRLASTGYVKPWLRAEVVGHLVKHSATFQLRTTASPLPRNF